MTEPRSTPAASSPRPALLLAGLAVAAHLAITAWLVVPGHLSLDEGTYHAMVASLARGGGLALGNGYEELRSRELEFAAVAVHDGRLMPLPPPIYPAVALPFYLVAGWRGLFWLQSLSFLGVAALTGWIARRWFPDQSLAAPAVAVFTLAGFAWIYSQAAWPHMLATLAVVGAWALAMRAAESRRSGWLLAAASGLALGLGIGVRLDAVFAAPALAAVIVAAAPRRPGRWLARLAALGAGALPPLLVLTLANRIKFGRASPFSYGDTGASGTGGISEYLPLLLGAAVVAALAGVLVGWRWRRRAPGADVGAAPAAVRNWLLAAALGLLLVTLAVPPLREALLRLLTGAAQLVVDLRFRDPDIHEPALVRSAGGAVMYLGGLKKALLQSCPYLVACALPLLAAGAQRARAWLLALPPLLYVGVYSYFAWHGGLCLNLRYLLPTLPFLSILSVLAWRMLLPGSAPGSGAARPWALGGAAVALLLFVGLLRLQPSAAGHERVLLTVPLVLAGCLGVLAAAAWRRGERSAGWRRAAAVALAAGWVWAGLVAFGYDYPWERRSRGYNLTVWSAIDPLVADRAMLAVSYPDPFFGFIESREVTIVVATRDEFADFRRLATHHLERGIPVYMAMEPPLWNAMRSLGLLEGLGVTPLWTDGRLFLGELEPEASAPGVAATAVPGEPAAPAARAGAPP